MLQQPIAAARRRSLSQSICNYPIWALNRVKIKMKNPTQKKRNKTINTQQNNTSKTYITVPYYKGLSEIIKKKCSNYGVQVYFKGGTTIKNLLVSPKDKDPMMKKSGVIYSYKCGRVECDEKYIGESSRTFGEGSRRGSRNNKRPPPPYLTILTPLVTT